jgi:hypothetical protein
MYIPGKQAHDCGKFVINRLSNSKGCASYLFTLKYGHLRAPFFLPFGYGMGRDGKLLELVSICHSLNNSEEMTIFGRNDTNTEGMTIIWKE